MMLSSQFPLDQSVWRILGKQSNPFEALVEKVKSVPLLELKKQAEGLRPFLFNEEEANLVVKAKEILPQLMKSGRGVDSEKNTRM